MDPVGGASLRAHFAALPDPRVARTRRHALLDVVTLAVFTHQPWHGNSVELCERGNFIELYAAPPRLNLRHRRAMNVHHLSHLALGKARLLTG